MNWGHYALAVLASVIVCSLTDWLFMGVLFHEKYKQHPEVWRKSLATGGESKAIAWSTLLTLLTCISFIYVCAVFGFATVPRACALSIGVWLAVPVPLLVSNSIFIKIHPYVAIAHSLGWLAKLLVCSLSASLIL